MILVLGERVKCKIAFSWPNFPFVFSQCYLKVKRIFSTTVSTRQFRCFLLTSKVLFFPCRVSLTNVNHCRHTKHKNKLFILGKRKCAFLFMKEYFVKILQSLARLITRAFIPGFICCNMTHYYGFISVAFVKPNTADFL